MARGEHPQRTPFYGACLMAAAFLLCWPASMVDLVWLRVTLYIVAALMGAVGSLMTLRDYSPSSRDR